MRTYYYKEPLVENLLEGDTLENHKDNFKTKISKHLKEEIELEVVQDYEDCSKTALVCEITGFLYYIKENKN